MQHVFIIGSKGIPAKYGGFETFVENLTEYKRSDVVTYHVACAVEGIPDRNSYEYHDAHCFCIPWRKLGSARAVAYDIDALNWSLDYTKRNKISHPIFYVLACRIGPFIHYFAKRIHEVGGVLYVNPDGHEWLRAKWNAPTRRYWKYSESQMVKSADLVICDSETIESYINREYARFAPKTIYIPYGAEVNSSSLQDDDPLFLEWLGRFSLRPNEYYLVVGRFVPENNYEIMIREFMSSSTDKSFVLITNVEEGFLGRLKEKTHYDTDARIKFVGTVYDQDLLKKIRENAYGYFHGHEVGGTNPSLLEAMASTNLNLLLDVGFNREVARESAVYWTKEKGGLSRVIDRCENLSRDEIDKLRISSTREIINRFSWDDVVNKYESLFLSTMSD